MPETIETHRRDRIARPGVVEQGRETRPLVDPALVVEIRRLVPIPKRLRRVGSGPRPFALKRTFFSALLEPWNEHADDHYGS